MAETAEPQGASSSGGIGSRVVDLAFGALPAIVGAFSLLGFVAAVGAGIDWVRFQAAGLPADEAVRVIDRSELVANGARSVAAFAVLAVFAVLAAFLLDSRGDLTVRLRLGIAVIAGGELMVAVWVARPLWWVYLLVLLAFVLLTSAVDRVIKALGTPPTGPEQEDRATRLAAAREELRTAHGKTLAAETALGCVPAGWPGFAEHKAVSEAQQQRVLAAYRLRSVLAEAEEAVAAADAVRAKKEAAKAANVAEDPAKPARDPEAVAAAARTAEKSDKADKAAKAAAKAARSLPELEANPLEAVSYSKLEAEAAAAAVADTPSPPENRRKILTKPRTLLWLGCAAVIGLGAPVFLLLRVAPLSWLGVIVLCIVVLNAAVYGVASASKRFLWYGVAVFVSVPTFGAILGAERTYRAPKLQPVALIRSSSDLPLCGIFIAETDKRVYLARVELHDEGDPRGVEGAGRIFWVPEANVDMIKIGPPQSIASANARAPLLARELYADRAEATPQASAAATSSTALPRKFSPHPATSSCTRVSLARLIAGAGTGVHQPKRRAVTSIGGPSFNGGAPSPASPSGGAPGGAPSPASPSGGAPLPWSVR